MELYLKKEPSFKLVPIKNNFIISHNFSYINKLKNYKMKFLLNTISLFLFL